MEEWRVELRRGMLPPRRGGEAWGLRKAGRRTGIEKVYRRTNRITDTQLHKHGISSKKKSNKTGQRPTYARFDE